MIQRPQRAREYGFTIVELLIVIVVIGILAAIALIAFSGISQRADVAAIQADLGNAGRQMKIFNVNNGVYPTANDCSASPVAGSICLTPSGSTTFQFSVNNTPDPRTFCITATRGTVSYYVNQETGAPLRGACPGHTDGGVAVHTFNNLTLTQKTANANWRGVAISADGVRMAATNGAGYVYTSSDAGTTWVAQTGSGSRAWRGITMSADGMKLAAWVSGSYIYTSSDYGVTWTTQGNSSGIQAWSDIASSADGTKIFAISSTGPTAGLAFLSADSGATWAQTSAPSRSYRGNDISNDGQILIAAPYSGYAIARSINGGATWADSNGGANFMGVACSATCTNWLQLTESGNFFTTTNSNVTRVTSTQSGSWRVGEVSGDGTKMVISDAGSTGAFLVSKDSGATWTTKTTSVSQTWVDFAFSYDGSTLIAISSGYLYVGTYD